MASTNYILVLLTCTIIFQVTWTAPSNNHCRPYCPKIYKPICGQQNTGDLKLFNNECQLNYEKCNNRAVQWQIVPIEQCLNINKLTSQNDCPRFCQKQLDPICAQDYLGRLKQFNNLCEFKQQQCIDINSKWNMVLHSKCPMVAQTFMSRECLGICTFEYQPICAINSSGRVKEFDNYCIYENELCTNRDAIWKVLNDGPCS